jgi:hypothetical protein
MAIPTKRQLEDKAISFCTVDQKNRKLFGTQVLFETLDADQKDVVRRLLKYYNYQVQSTIMSLELTGKILHIGERQQVTEKFAKRIFTIETKSGQYPEFVALQFVQDRTDLLDPFAVGQEVRVHFNAKSREYNGNWYTELTARGIAAATAPPAETPAPTTPETTKDDLPF